MHDKYNPALPSSTRQRGGLGLGRGVLAGPERWLGLWRWVTRRSMLRRLRGPTR